MRGSARKPWASVAADVAAGPKAPGRARGLVRRAIAGRVPAQQTGMEIVGHRAGEGGNRFEVASQDAKATLVSFGAPGRRMAPLRRRRLIADSPRILACDDRAAHLAAEAERPR